MHYAFIVRVKSSFWFGVLCTEFVVDMIAMRNAVMDMHERTYSWERRPCMYDDEGRLAVSQERCNNMCRRRWFVNGRAIATLTERREKLLAQYGGKEYSWSMHVNVLVLQTITDNC